jgi:hypothetical protein
MARALTKSIFGVPDTEMLRAIEDEQKATALRQAAFEFDAKRRDLETKFEAALAALRGQYLAAVAEITAAA